MGDCDRDIDRAISIVTYQIIDGTCNVSLTQDNSLMQHFLLFVVCFPFAGNENFLPGFVVASLALSMVTIYRYLPTGIIHERSLGNDAARQTETAATVGQRNVGQYSNRNLSLQIKNSRHSGANKEKRKFFWVLNYIVCFGRKMFYKYYFQTEIN